MSKQNETPTIPAPPPEDDDSPTIPMKRSELEVFLTICAKGVTR